MYLNCPEGAGAKCFERAALNATFDYEDQYGEIGTFNSTDKLLLWVVDQLVGEEFDLLTTLPGPGERWVLVKSKQFEAIYA